MYVDKLVLHITVVDKKALIPPCHARDRIHSCIVAVRINVSCISRGVPARAQMSEAACQHPAFVMTTRIL